MDASAASLLSLSIAAASASPIPLQHQSNEDPSQLNNPPPPPIQLSSSIGTTPATHKTHRRLSSTGKARRRLSDAREAANRPSPAVLHASPPALSLASLSLSSSPPSTTHQSSTSLTSAAVAATAAAPLNDGSNVPRVTASAINPDASPNAKPIPIGSGKKRGVEHKCESCSKIYRHPSCLIKHRWEHTPHWREASKFVLSKHQQVQLLEAAAILSHLSPQSSSLPEDRSLWPSFLSGGSLPPPDPSTLMMMSTTSDSQQHKRSASASVSTSMTGNPTATAITPATAAAAATANGNTAVVVSSSVPATVTGFNRASSTGPRMHDYSIPIGISGIAAVNGTTSNTSNSSTHPTTGVTQVRPGLFGIPNGHTPTPTNGGQPMSVPITTTTSSHSWSSVSIVSESGGGGGGGGGGDRTGWSLPRSSIRSISGSSRSRSKSASDEENDMVEEEEEENESVDGDEGSISSSPFGRGVGLYYGSSGRRYGNGYSHHRTQPPPTKAWKREEEDLTTTFGNGMNWSLKEEDEYEKGGNAADVVVERKVVVPASGVRDEKEWDGMEMEMDMD